MMKVMKSNVAREPLQDFGQFVERTPFERRRGVIPVIAMLPIGCFKLMLHVEQPEPGGTSDEEHRELNEQISLEAKQPAQCGSHHQNRQRRPVHPAALLPARIGLRKSMFDQQQEQRSQYE